MTVLTLLLRLVVLLIVAGLAFLLVAYQGPDDPQQVNFRRTPEQFELHRSDQPFNFVELDDQGNLALPVQAQFTLDAIGQQLGRSDLVVVLYLHDAGHNAGLDDGDVGCFARMLQAAADLQGRQGYRIHGVYVGWPGVVSDSPWLQRLAFPGRESAAERVGAGGHLLWLLRQIRGLRGQHPGHRFRFVIVAHGLGARLLQHALLAGGGQGDAGPDLADLVVAVNPAVAAAEMDAPWLHSRNRRAPRWVLATSERDEVLPRDFFWTQVAEAALQHPSEAQPWAQWQAAGLIDARVTHDLRLQGGADLPAPVVGCELPDPIERELARSRQPRQEPVNYWLIDHRDAQGRPLYLTQLVARRPVMDPSVMVVRVDGRILPSHAAVFTPPFVDFVARVLSYSVDRADD